jgi:acyl carrier protein
VEILIYIKDEIMTSKIEKVIVDSLLELNEELENSELNNPTKETKLYGGNGVLDSLALVSFITDLEERISDEFDEDIILADEKAMSQRTSPFRNVEALTIYIQKLLEE